MSTNLAIIVEKPGLAVKAEVPRPTLRDDYILVRVQAVALNPTDWKHVDFLTSKGALIGCDYAGIVEEIGSAVTKPFQVGDTVCGFVHGGNEVQHEDGAFANYILAKGDLQIHIPSTLKVEEASTLGVGITTVGQALYQSLGLPLPVLSDIAFKSGEGETTKQTILIYGGSTATGALAIQFAKLSGLRVVTTSSPNNFDYLRSLGATAVFDYNSSSCSSDIRTAYPDIYLALDCISAGKSSTITVGAMSRVRPGYYSSLLPVSEDALKTINDTVKVKSTLAYTALGEYFMIGPKRFEAIPEDLEFVRRFWELAAALLESKQIQIHKPSINKYGDGFKGILNGLQAMREGKVSAEKLVVTL
ncbi:unnamed protein product [Blumeria hordei]|uniref:Enoyl reductase (ER) domain-containing protein n=1 Tax=Blumeria hordei TaxID=2867405 RepID=A0A383UJ21_BLUHO|nr:unnamed protein product [Blumeria hordei]